MASSSQTTAVPASSAESNAYEFPVTNKALGEKIAAYQKFISEYIVQAQIEKVKAVADAEKKIREQYDALLGETEQEQ